MKIRWNIRVCRQRRIFRGGWDFFGKVMGIRSLISYEGTDARSLVEDFHGAVDDYLQLCEGQGKAPEKHTREALISGSHLRLISSL